MREFGEFRLETIAAGPLQTNTYLITSGDESILIDSGTGYNEIIAKLSLEGRKVKAFIMTHGHFDHIFDALEYKRVLGCQLLIGKGEDSVLGWSYSVSQRYMGKATEPFVPDRILKDGDTLSLGSSELRVISLPGHTEGSIGIIAGPLFFTGDVLFQGTIGRTDIGGSMEEMENSLKKISHLDQKMLVFPGHGPETKLKTELESNPFLTGMH